VQQEIKHLIFEEDPIVTKKIKKLGIFPFKKDFLGFKAHSIQKQKQKKISPRKLYINVQFICEEKLVFIL